MEAFTSLPARPPSLLRPRVMTPLAGGGAFVGACLLTPATARVGARVGLATALLTTEVLLVAPSRRP